LRSAAPGASDTDTARSTSGASDHPHGARARAAARAAAAGWSACSGYSPRCAVEAGFVTATENFDGCSRTAGLSISEMRSISLIH
jgi:hypothetical protein